MRDSVLTYDEAMAMANSFAEDCKADGLTVYLEDAAADCEAFPCPQELGTWSGETCAIYIYNCDTNEEIYAVAYWN